MWAEYMKTKNLQAAEMWKNTLESERLPCKILPDGKSIDDWAENLNYVIYVPIGREHVADEIIRKI